MTQYQYLKAPKDKFWVEPENLIKDETITPGGIILRGAIANKYREEIDPMCRVVSVPQGFSKMAEMDPASAHSRLAKEGEFVKIIDLSVIKEGDRVYVNPWAFDSSVWVWKGTEPGVKLFLIKGQSIIYIERGEEIIPLGQHSIVEPIVETEEEITTKSGLLAKATIENKIQRGVLRWKGQDIDGSFEELQPGDCISWSLKDARAAIPIKVRGKDYILVRWAHILGVLPPISEEEIEARRKKQEDFNHKNFEYAKSVLRSR